MIKFSIVLPVYNVEKFLPDCLDSLYHQDVPETEYEIICVIDGSPDHSADVVRKYQETHADLKLIEQPNSGVCAARNRGFAEVQGKYVWFIDPDDMIAADCFGKIFRMLEDNQADIFELDYATCEESTKYVPQIVDFEIDGQNRPGSSGSGCLSVCRADYLREHRIEWNTQLHYGEDYLWALQTKYRKHKSIYTHAKLYFYRQRGNSAMHAASREKTGKHLQDMLTLRRIYKKEFQRCQTEMCDDWHLKDLFHRMDLCTEAALFLFIFLTPSMAEYRKMLETLKREGAYPYHFPFWKVYELDKLKSIKYISFTFLFSFEPYYFLIMTLYRMLSCRLRKV